MNGRDIRTICNLGTGTMGFGTALVFAMHGYTVRMFGRSDASVDRGFAQMRQSLGTYLQQGLVTEADSADILARVTGCTSLQEAVPGADFVIESVAEELAIKQDVWSKVEALATDQTIFATNTSGLSPSRIAASLRHPERFVVTHFWNPPHLVPLVEIVPGERTSPDVVEAARWLIEHIGKKAVVLKKEVPGFIGNRLQYALLREALYLVEQGVAEPEVIDLAVTASIGRRLCVTGPIQSADMGGLDIFCGISDYLNADLCNAAQASPLLRQAVADGHFGTKNGKGLYDWPEDIAAKARSKREQTLLDFLRKDREEACE